MSSAAKPGLTISSKAEQHTPRVDAHHHLWSYVPEEFDWIDDRMRILRRDFYPPDLRSARIAASVPFTVVVQARRTLDENSFLLQCAGENPSILGVVGWVPLASPEVSAILDRLSGNPHVVGIREIAQGQPEGFFENTAFNAGIVELTKRELTYDILIYQDQLPEVIRFVDRHPKQTFVLDHAAKPLIARNELEPWASLLRDLAQRPNVTCKLSGLVTEANWQTWTPETLAPYLDVCVDAFGPQRLLAGSDWPVCLVAATYKQWWTVLEHYFASFSPDEQRQVFGMNALRVYHLSLPEQTR